MNPLIDGAAGNVVVLPPAQKLHAIALIGAAMIRYQVSNLLPDRQLIIELASSARALGFLAMADECVMHRILADSRQQVAVTSTNNISQV